MNAPQPQTHLRKISEYITLTKVMLSTLMLLIHRGQITLTSISGQNIHLLLIIVEICYWYHIAMLTHIHQINLLDDHLYQCGVVFNEKKFPSKQLSTYIVYNQVHIITSKGIHECVALRITTTINSCWFAHFQMMKWNICYLC